VLLVLGRMLVQLVLIGLMVVLLLLMGNYPGETATGYAG